RVLAAMADCRGAAVLSGHLHTTHVACTALREGDSGWAVLLSQAGTATSTRLRGQEASFNVLIVRPKFIQSQPYVWDNQQLCFAPLSATNFSRGGTGWGAIR